MTRIVFGSCCCCPSADVPPLPPVTGVACCPGGVPQELWVSLDATGCPCLDGVQVRVKYVGITGGQPNRRWKWTSSAAALGGGTTDLDVCGGLKMYADVACFEDNGSPQWDTVAVTLYRGTADSPLVCTLFGVHTGTWLPAGFPAGTVDATCDPFELTTSEVRLHVADDPNPAFCGEEFSADCAEGTAVLTVTP